MQAHHEGGAVGRLQRRKDHAVKIVTLSRAQGQTQASGHSAMHPQPLGPKLVQAGHEGGAAVGLQNPTAQIL